MGSKLFNNYLTYSETFQSTRAGLIVSHGTSNFAVHLTILFIETSIFLLNYSYYWLKKNKYAIHAYTHGPVTGSGLSVSLTQ